MLASYRNLNKSELPSYLFKPLRHTKPLIPYLTVTPNDPTIELPQIVMSAEQTFTGDLRKDAKEYNRDKTSRVKWAHGQAYGPGRREEDGKPRPAKVAPHIR